MSTIPLVDLQAQYRAIKPEIDAAIQRVLDRGQFILGPEVEALEQEIASYCGTKYAVGVASGTDALELSLRACGIGAGDEVITTAFSFFATAEAIVAVGATPVFIDIELATYNFEPAELAARVTPRTRAILPVHLYGHPCNWTAVQQVAERHGLRVIEDCAQAIGAEFQGRRVGALGDAGAFSFFPSKNLGGYGDGGMVVTNDSALADRVRLLRAHGSREKYWHLVLGKNSRLDELQAAILRVKLRHLNRWVNSRREVARWYAEGSRAALQGISLPKEQPGSRHAYHQFVIRTEQRDQLKQVLAARGIASQVYYPSTLPSQPALAPYLGLGGRYPNADLATRELLALPIYPELTQSAVERICDTISSQCTKA